MGVVWSIKTTLGNHNLDLVTCPLDCPMSYVLSLMNDLRLDFYVFELKNQSLKTQLSYDFSPITVINI